MSAAMPLPTALECWRSPPLGSVQGSALTHGCRPWAPRTVPRAGILATGGLTSGQEARHCTLDDRRKADMVGAMRRGGDRSASRTASIAGRAALLLALTGCGLIPSPAPNPPTILAAGVVTDAKVGQTIEYTYADGTTREVNPDGYRQLTPAGWSGPLVILGHDDTGLFVASFMTQDGLPSTCYFENAEGIARGSYIETRGVQWPKASSVASTASGSAYPIGTRFCFNERGVIDGLIAP